MNFLVFLWNIFARIVRFFGYIFMEIVVFYLVCCIFPPFIYLTPIFIIWLIVDIIFTIAVGGTSNLIKWILSKA